MDESVVTVDREALARQAQRYLAAVAVFRAEGVEPRWQPERVSSGVREAPKPARGLRLAAARARKSSPGTDGRGPVLTKPAL